MTDPQNGNLGPEGSYFESKARKEDEIHRQKLNGLYPLIITFLFLVLCFFGLWHPGWMLFFAIPLYYMRPKSRLSQLGNPVMITLIYLVLGFAFHLWHPGWLIFLAIPAVAIMEKAEKPSKEHV